MEVTPITSTFPACQKEGIEQGVLNNLEFIMEEIDSMDMENRDYTEVCMVLGEVFCARVEKDGQISIKVYNENGNPYEAYFKIRHGMGLECIRSTYPMEYMEALLNLMDRQLPFTVDWARG